MSACSRLRAPKLSAGSIVTLSASMARPRPAVIKPENADCYPFDYERLFQAHSVVVRLTLEHDA
jgi:hypothetical protein